MAFLDFLIDEEGIQEQRRMADEVARERFNPNVLDPQLDQASRMATEGIADEQIRDRVLESIFNRGIDSNQISGGFESGRALAFLDRLNQQRGEQLGRAELDISMAEEEAMREGEAREAEIQTQRRQLESQRESRIKENRLRAEAEASKRKKQIGAEIGRLAGTIAGSSLGPLGAAGAGALSGGIFGGDSGFVTGAVSGGGTAMRREQMEGILGGSEAGDEEQDQGFNLLNFLRDRIGREGGDQRTQEDLEFISRILGGSGFPSELNLAQ